MAGRENAKANRINAYIFLKRTDRIIPLLLRLFWENLRQNAGLTCLQALVEALSVNCESFLLSPSENNKLD